MQRDSKTVGRTFATEDASIIDLQAVLERVGGDGELLHEIIAIFLDEYPRLLAGIGSSLESRDARALERSAHTIKGSVSNFGARSATQAAQDLELIGRRSDFDCAPGAVETLKSELEALHSALTRLQVS
jgi:two-component system, sensor histidine kinase and response regulator